MNATSSREIKLTFKSFVSLVWRAKFMTREYQFRTHPDFFYAKENPTWIWIEKYNAPLVKLSVWLISIAVTLVQIACFVLYFLLYEGWLSNSSTAKARKHSGYILTAYRDKCPSDPLLGPY